MCSEFEHIGKQTYYILLQTNLNKNLRSDDAVDRYVV
jgi:hypothetical protein